VVEGRWRGVTLDTLYREELLGRVSGAVLGR
jgi:hypothetical protein